MTIEQVERILGGTDELIPCPFCGGPGRKECHVIEKEATPGSQRSLICPRQERVIFLVRCEECGCRTGEFHSKDKAIEAWNRREG